MRISDWSSDVCSSDLDPPTRVSQFAAAPRVSAVNSSADRPSSMVYACFWTAPTFGHALYTYRCDPDASHAPAPATRSEERRVGKECVRKGRFGWSPGV